MRIHLLAEQHGTDRRRQSDSFPRQLSPSSQFDLWYEKYGLQARVAANYRSAEAVQQNYGGIQGFESTRRVHLPRLLLELRLWKDAHGLFRGLQPDGGKQHFYLVWPVERNLSSASVGA